MNPTDKNGMPADEQEPEALFANVNFSVVPGKSLKEDQIRELTTRLESHGGAYVPLLPDTGRIALDRVSHIIATTSDFPDYHAACEAMISVVKPEWVTASVARNKLAQIRPYSPDPRQFFAGVTISCADLPAGDKDAIIGGVVATGGQYSGALSRLVTHIVALTDQHEKCQQAISKKLPCTIVLPHWFDDCLRLGKRIDDRPYRLPNPEITRVSSSDPVQLPSDVHLKGASSPQPGQLPTPKAPDSVRSDLNVFRGKKVMLSSDLDLGSRLRGTIEDLIASGGGSVTGSIHKADIYVCHYRDGPEYRIASRAGKDVGNLPWLYYLIAHNAWTSPLRRLLHYPVARDGLPGFDKYQISLSNYGGEARLYLENLVLAAGGEYTKTLRQDNTHLITARPNSEKCAAAREWNIHMVNHLWLEESYARWEQQSLTNPRYNHFPPRTNLGEVVGQTQIDKNAMEAVFFPPDEDDTTDEERAGPTPIKPKDQNTPSKVRPSIVEVGGRAPQPQQPQQQQQQQQQQQAAVATSTTTATATTTAAKASPAKALAIRNSHLGRLKDDENRRPKTPTRASVDGPENRTPSTTGSRGAKERAVAKLHDLAPDIALYEKEKRRVGGVIRGGRRGDEVVVVHAGTKRSRSRPSDDDDDDEHEDGHEDGDGDGDEDDDDDDAGGNTGSDANARQGRDVKRAKRTKPPPATMRLLITGYQRWHNRPKVEDDDKRRLRDFGIAITQEPSQCTHLAASSMIRTQKFVMALAYGPVVISTAFIQACLEQSRLLSPADYVLVDDASERRLGISLRDSLARAKRNQRRLLRGLTVYVTPTVHGGVDTYRAIVEANGGTCVPFRARGVSIARQLLPPNGSDRNVRSRNGGTRIGQDAEEGKDGGGGGGNEQKNPTTRVSEEEDEGQQQDDDEEDEAGVVYLLSGETPDEKKLWPRFRRAVLEAGYSPRIVRTEWLLDVAMSQELKWKEDYELIG